MSDEYLAVNKANWDQRAPAHAASPGYGVDHFLADPEHLSGVIRFDLSRLGDVAGLRGVHLQCHIGTDTLSLHRLGARMTGLDLSSASLVEARRLAASCGAEIEYVESEVYRALDVLEPGAFDLVYTGMGALCWLPSVARWAEVVAGLLKPGGRLFIREGHPVLWSLEDDRADDELVIAHSYGEMIEPLEWNDDSTYVPTDVTFTATRTLEWNHGIGEILTAVLDAGLAVRSFVEHDSVPWEAIPGRMELLEGGEEWRLADRPERLPHSYTLQAVKI